MLNKYKYHLLVLFAGMSWSSLAIFSKYATIEKIDPFNQVFWRITIGLLGSFLLGRFFFKEKVFINKKIIIYLMINGFFFVFGYTTITTAIYLGSPVAKAVALSYSYPITVVILSYLIFKDRPSSKNILAIILSLASIVALMELWHVKNIAQLSYGDIFAWMNSLAFGGLIVWGTKIRKDLKLNPFSILSISWIFSLPLLFFLGMFLRKLNIFLFSPVIKINFSLLGWASLISLGVFSSILPLTLMYFASSKLKSFTTSLLLLSEPVFVYIAGIFLFNQQLSIWGIIGMIGIIISVLLV